VRIKIAKKDLETARDGFLVADLVANSAYSKFSEAEENVKDAAANLEVQLKYSLRNLFEHLKLEIEHTRSVSHSI
jgi:hypothetical protein